MKVGEWFADAMIKPKKDMLKFNRKLWTQWIARSALLGSILPWIGAQAPAGQDAGPGSAPTARQIPGITAADAFPGGCVDCHVDYPDMGLDARISTLMAGWRASTRSNFMSRMRALGPEGVGLKGRHPEVSSSLKDIPGACIRCHAKSSTRAPALGQMMHVIHLGGVSDGHFLSTFQGECTHCHKLQMSTGTWRMPSGPERPKAGQAVKGRKTPAGENPAGDRGGVDEETFYFIVSPLYALLFTGAAVCLYRGFIAWCPRSYGEETSRHEA